MLQIGLVGCGFMGRHHATAYRASTRGRLVAVCDVDATKSRAFADEFGARAYPDIETMLRSDSIDVVDVVTPPEHHLQPVLAAVEAAKHVFVEKPLAENLADAERMVAAARARGVTLATNFNRRYGHGYQLAREFQVAGRLGDFAYIILKIAVGIERSPKHPYHAAFDLLIHAADLARLFGGDLRRVSALMSDRRHGTAYHNMTVALEFARGGTGTILISLDSSRLHPIEFAEICGTAGHAQVHNVVAGFDFFPHDSDLASSWRPQPFGGRQHLLQFYPTTIESHVEELLAALTEGRAPPVPGEDGVSALRIVLAAIRSFETGAAVEPSSIDADTTVTEDGR